MRITALGIAGDEMGANLNFSFAGTLLSGLLFVCGVEGVVGHIKSDASFDYFSALFSHFSVVVILLPS